MEQQQPPQQQLLQGQQQQAENQQTRRPLLQVNQAINGRTINIADVWEIIFKDICINGLVHSTYGVCKAFDYYRNQECGQKTHLHLLIGPTKAFVEHMIAKSEFKMLYDDSLRNIVVHPDGRREPTGPSLYPSIRDEECELYLSHFDEASATRLARLMPNVTNLEVNVSFKTEGEMEKMYRAISTLIHAYGNDPLRSFTLRASDEKVPDPTSIRTFFREPLERPLFKRVLRTLVNTCPQLSTLSLELKCDLILPYKVATFADDLSPLLRIVEHLRLAFYGACFAVKRGKFLDFRPEQNARLRTVAIVTATCLAYTFQCSPAIRLSADFQTQTLKI